MANSVDPDETPRSAASHLGLYCLLRPVCPNTYGKYGILSYYQVVSNQFFYIKLLFYLGVNLKIILLRCFKMHPMKAESKFLTKPFHEIYMYDHL